MLVGKASPEDYNLHPSHYPWAIDLYNQAVRNTWFPHEIALKEDLYDWEKMTDEGGASPSLLKTCGSSLLGPTTDTDDFTDTDPTLMPSPRPTAAPQGKSTHLRAL